MPFLLVMQHGLALERCIVAACTALKAGEPLLTAADLKVGDGDCGTTMAKGAGQILGASHAALPLVNDIV